MKLIFINNAEPRYPYRFSVKFFNLLLKKALQILKNPPVSEKVPETELELVLLNDSAIRSINKQTRGLDKPTDVLSFSNREIPLQLLVPTRRRGQFRLPKSMATQSSLGQIFISLPAAQRNADEMQQSLEEEVRFLFIHGLLHILGYDHQTPAEETTMMTLAYQILGRAPYKP